MTTTMDAPDPGADLLSAALICKLARELGAPRLAARAARRAGELADAVVIALSPAVARTTQDQEDQALDGVRTSGDLVALRWPVKAEVEER